MAIDYLACIQENATVLAESIRHAGLDAPVPTCPDWKAADLAAHIIGVHTWVEATVRERATEYLDAKTLPPPPSADDGIDALAIGIQERAGALVKTLSDTPLDAPIWNWSVNKPKNASFWPRRMAQETVIHRVDAEAAAGVASVVPVDVAVDGIDELLDVFLPARAAYLGNVKLGGALHVRTTDAEAEWLVRCEGKECEVTRGPGTGGAAAAGVCGPASDLLLWLWNRLAADAPAVETSGDQSVLDNWRAFAV